MKLPFILLLAFTSSVLYAAPAGQDLKMIPLSKAELETTNAGLAALVKKVNKDLPGLIVSNKIDPLPRVATGNARKDLFIGICQASGTLI